MYTEKLEFYPKHPSDLKTAKIETRPMPILSQNEPFAVKTLFEEFLENNDDFFAHYVDKRFCVTGVAKKVGPDIHNKPSIELSDAVSGKTYLQVLCVDDTLDLLAISLPPGSGKTTLALFLLSFLAGRDPNNPILTGSHSNAFIRGCYDEVLRLVDPQGEYLWKDVFPGIKVSSTNAKDCRIDFDKWQRFETLEFTSIGTGTAGLPCAEYIMAGVAEVLTQGGANDSI